MNPINKLLEAILGLRPLNHPKHGSEQAASEVIKAEDNQAVKFEDSSPLEQNIVIGRSIEELQTEVLRLAEFQLGSDHYSMQATFHYGDGAHIDVRVYHPYFLRKDKQDVIQAVRKPKPCISTSSVTPVTS